MFDFAFLQGKRKPKNKTAKQLVNNTLAFSFLHQHAVAWILFNF
jgi:hypothetical protein